MMGAAGVEVGYRTQSRVNGWSWPLHPFQFIAWLFFVYFGLMYFLVLVPAVLIIWQPVAYATVGVLFLIHIVAHLICVSINPADASVLAKMSGLQGKVQVPTLDRSKHKHAIEDQHCYLCEVDVGASSKHCSACNKCIGNFDHHCKWLNNCVGRRNYKLFLSTLVSALLGCLIILILSILLFTAYYTDKNSGNFLKPYKDFHNRYTNNSYANTSYLQGDSTLTPLLTSANPINVSSSVFTVFHQRVVQELWLFLVAFTGILALVAIGLLGHLYGFHVYLMCKGMTTYDYIVRQRENEEKEAREREWKEKDGSDSRCRNAKHLCCWSPRQPTPVANGNRPSNQSSLCKQTKEYILLKKWRANN